MPAHKAVKPRQTRRPHKQGRPKASTPARGDRIDFRVNPETKELLVRAAALHGTSLTAFVLESAQERAVDLIERYERLRLTDRDRDRLLDALEQPVAPTEALRRAFQKFA